MVNGIQQDRFEAVRKMAQERLKSQGIEIQPQKVDALETLRQTIAAKKAEMSQSTQVKTQKSSSSAPMSRNQPIDFEKIASLQQNVSIQGMSRAHSLYAGQIQSPKMDSTPKRTVGNFLDLTA